MVDTNKKIWRKDCTKIVFDVGPSKGTKGLEWIHRFEELGYSLDGQVKELLCSTTFVSSSGLKYNGAIHKLDAFGSSCVTSEKILEEALNAKGYRKPSLELLCMIREGLPKKELIDKWCMNLSKIIFFVEGLGPGEYLVLSEDSITLEGFEEGSFGPTAGLGFIFL